VLSRLRIDASYHERLAEYFHALRPLSVQVDTTSDLVWRELQKLGQHVACKFHRAIGPTSADANPSGDQSHFSVWIDGDGEACRVQDEQGSEVRGDVLAALLAVNLCREAPGTTIVLDKASSSDIVQAIEQANGRVVLTAGSRQQMSRAMQESGALVGGDRSGRCWFAHPCPHADALRTLATLLVILSQSDRPLSAVIAADIFGQTSAV
jgi:phosphomannomutase